MLTSEAVAVLLACSRIAPTPGAPERLARSLSSTLDMSLEDTRSLDLDIEPAAYLLARGATAADR